MLSKSSIKKGFSFGLTSATITTLGLMVGLNAGTSSRLAVIGGVLTIAIADAFSDALGIHISVEYEANSTPRHIWEATVSTFLAKFLFALTFLIPLLIFSLSAAIIISIAWGIIMLGFFSYLMARMQKMNPLEVVGEHLIIAVVVIAISHMVGDWIRYNFV
ncbi:MAG: hypothetical protein WCW77_03675 [Patescibacteria group bacterium]|jgi:VIT1/CCC1 family predicted Fe2+/Mn2+ transporter